MLYGDKKNVVWVIGRLAAGKTSHIRGIIETDPDKLMAVFPGQACREHFGAQTMAECENPTAPEMTESFVRNLICDAVDRIEPGMTLFVDGFPRTPNQVEWLYDQFVRNSGLACMFLVYTCDDVVRKARALKRDEGTKNESLMNARLITDDRNQLRVLEEILMRNAYAVANKRRSVPLTLIDNTKDIPHIAGMPPFVPTQYVPIDGRIERAMEDLRDAPEVAGISFDDRNLATMMACNATLSDQTLAPLNLTMEKLRSEAVQHNEMPLMATPVDWTRRFVSRAIEELNELLEQLPETWWSKELADIRKARVELIDAWHFMMSASQSLGMDATFFARTYYAKLKVNLKRQANGYDKRVKKKGDDNHVGVATRPGNGEESTGE